MKEEVLPIFGVPDGRNDYLISLQTVGQPHEIFDQEEMNGKTVSEVGIQNVDALNIIIVHKAFHRQNFTDNIHLNVHLWTFSC